MDLMTIFWKPWRAPDVATVVVVVVDGNDGSLEPANWAVRLAFSASNVVIFCSSVLILVRSSSFSSSSAKFYHILTQ